MTKNNEEKNRRVKLAIGGLFLVVVSYAIAKITNDVSGDWFKFSILCIGLIGVIGGCLTFTDIFGRKM